MTRVSKFVSPLGSRLSVRLRYTSALLLLTITLGRTIDGDRAHHIFKNVIPSLVHNLSYVSMDRTHIEEFVDSIEDQEDLRRQIDNAGMGKR